MLLWRNWQTRCTQNAVPSGVRVRVPLGVPIKFQFSVNFLTFTFIIKYNQIRENTNDQKQK